MHSVIVLILILSPFRVPLPTHAGPEWWDGLKQVGTVLEVSGPRCMWIQNFQSEMQWVRMHYRECQGLPPISDCQRLPSHGDCQQFCRFEAEYMHWLEDRWCMRTGQREIIWDLVIDSRRVREFWLAAAGAQDESQAWCRRRLVLAELRRMVGDECYNAGLWPSPVRWR